MSSSKTRRQALPRLERLHAEALAVLLLSATGCGRLDSFNPVTPRGRDISNLFNFELVLSAIVFSIVFVWLMINVTRFRGRDGESEPPQIHGDKRLEIGWTSAAVTLLFVVIFPATIFTMNRVEASDPNAMKVLVIGHQWWWEYQYPDLGITTANELHLPVGTSVELQIQSADVVHSFWVPQIGWKADAIPLKRNAMNAHFEQTGVFDGACAEYCGTQHAWMRIRVVAEPRPEFDRWAVAQRQPSPTAGVASRGQQVFAQNTCVNCHTIQGTQAAATAGPDLSHFGSRSQLGSGVRPNTPDNLRAWVRNPQDVKPGALMPIYTQLSEADLNALVEYLEGLK